jgi:hypothetical protein
MNTKTNQSPEGRRRRSRATVEPGQIRQIEEHIMDFIEHNEWLCRGEGSIRLLQADLSEKQLQCPIFKNRSKVSSDVKKALYIVQLICQSRDWAVERYSNRKLESTCVGTPWRRQKRAQSNSFRMQLRKLIEVKANNYGIVVDF